jgi:FkbM family methyltransferase
MVYSHVDNKGISLESKLASIFGNKQNGFFIELGANDGLTQSNTAFFEKKLGWTGILIEPSEIAYNKCKINRPNSICLNYACVSNKYKDEYIYGDFSNDSLMASIDGIRNNNSNLIKVKAITLEQILNKYDCKQIDFLSLDTEGYELNILEGLNLDKHRPKFMLIEIYNKDFDNIIKFLESNHYELHSNISNYNKIDNPGWDGTHNDYLFIDKK